MKFASVIYIIAMIVGVLWWLGGLLFAVMGGSSAASLARCPAAPSVAAWQ